MKITIEVSEGNEMKQLIQWLEENNMLEKVEVNSISANGFKQPYIQKGDKTIDPDALKGIWKDNPRTLEEIRKDAWR